MSKAFDITPAKVITPILEPVPEPPKSILVRLIPQVILRKLQVIKPVIPTRLLRRLAPPVTQPVAFNQTRLIPVVNNTPLIASKPPIMMTQIMQPHSTPILQTMLQQPIVKSPPKLQPISRQQLIRVSPDQMVHSPIRPSIMQPMMMTNQSNRLAYTHSVRQMSTNSPYIPLVSNIRHQAPLLIKQKSDPISLQPVKRPVRTNLAYQSRLNMSSLKRTETF